jgi:predicted aspartyl protease
MRAATITTLVASATAGVLAALLYLEKTRTDRTHEQKPAIESGDDELSRAWKRVVASPRDSGAWLMLGDVQAARDQAEAAEHSYRTAVTVSAPDDGAAHARLGFQLYARGEDAAALPLLREAQRRGWVDSMLAFTIKTIEEHLRQKTVRSSTSAASDASVAEDASLPPAEPERPDTGVVAQARPEPPTPPKHPPPRAEQECAVALSRVHGRGGFLIDAEIDGVSAKMLIDTGATITVISSDLLHRIARPLEQNSVRVLTANGPVTMPLASVGALTIAGRGAEGTIVAVCEDCMQGIADGLLGLDLQAALGIQLELRTARATFADCAQP